MKIGGWLFKQVLVIMFAVMMLLSITSFKPSTTSDSYYVPAVKLNIELTLSFTSSIFRYATGFLVGFAEEIIADLECIWLLLLHPYDALCQFVNAFYHYEETYLSIKHNVAKILVKYSMYSSENRGRLHGMFIVEFIWMFAPLNFSLKICREPVKKIKFTIDQKITQLKNNIPFRMSPMVLRITEQVNPISLAEWFVVEKQPS